MDYDTPPRRAPVALLWTGGWDSSFRLLQLLLEHRVPVTPMYLVDDTRASAPIELATMERIRAALAEAHPQTRELLQPMVVSRVADIAPDADIDRAFARLAARAQIGSQYAWLARFARQHGRLDVEMSAECTRHGASALLLDAVEQVRSPHGYTTYRLPPDLPDRDVASVFGGFSYPLMGTTRQDMTEAVKRNGWGELMGMTWFCHRPTSGGQPCGLCNPCRYVIDEGFAWRISPGRRALSSVYRVTLLPLRTLARNLLLRLRAAGHS